MVHSKLAHWKLGLGSLRTVFKGQVKSRRILRKTWQEHWPEMSSQLCKAGRIEKLWRCHQVNPVQKFGQLGLSHTLCQHYHKHRSVEDDPVSLYQERRA